MPIFKNPEAVENDLHRLLLRAVPENSRGNKTVTHLASLVPCSKWAVQKWIINGRLTPARVNRVVEIGEIDAPVDDDGNPVGRVKREDFEPFVYNV